MLYTMITYVSTTTSIARIGVSLSLPFSNTLLLSFYRKKKKNSIREGTRTIENHSEASHELQNSHMTRACYSILYHEKKERRKKDKSRDLLVRLPIRRRSRYNHIDIIRNIHLYMTRLFIDHFNRY